MSTKPVIGITFDSQDPGGYCQYPWYALRENYCTAVVNGGGVPLPLIHDLDLIDDYLSLIDGLLITGGGQDVNPTLYGIQEIHPTVKLNPRRTIFEKNMAENALQKNLPLLGICGGEQVLNVTLGGTLIQHIPDEVPNALHHQQLQPHEEPTHKVKIEKGTLLYQIVKTEKLLVNSLHHQAIKDPAPGVVVNARASDGVIEGIEAPAYKFCLGLQWHPEFIVDPQEAAIFKAFIKASCG